MANADNWICVTCGTEHALTDEPPARCAICSDARQFVGFDGQQWTTRRRLSEDHKNVFVEEEPGVYSLYTQPDFAVGQRAFLIQAGVCNVLWDCLSLLDSDTERKIRELGGVDHIAISHPHYYTSMGAWSLAFSDAPIHLHGDDRAWVMNLHANVKFWEGETLPLASGLTLIHTPGHFDGFQVLHWHDGAYGEGALFCGDQPQVCMDREWLSFMYSYPNLIPLGPGAVKDIVGRLIHWDFDRIYGAFPRRTVFQNARERLQESARRYLQAISPDQGVHA